MNKKELTQRLIELEDTVTCIERHLYDAVSNDIENLHEQVNIWGSPKLKDRVEALEQKVGISTNTKYSLVETFVRSVNDASKDGTLTEQKLGQLIDSYLFLRVKKDA